MTTETITPVAIDAFVPIDTIDVNGRHRRDMGDIQALADSIADVGLLNPVTLTREGRLVAGHRRIEAVRLLGMDTVPVRFADNLDDAAKLLRAERDENVCRLDMKPSEKAALGEALLAIEADRARERTAQAGRSAAPGRRAERSGDVSGPLGGDSRDAVGKALGMSGRTYSELRGAYALANDPDAPAEHRQAAQEALDKMDAGEGIYLARKELRQKITAKPAEAEPGAAEPEPESPDADWVPLPNEKGPRPAKRRRELIAEMGAHGYTSGHISDRLGILPQTVRQIAREESIEIIGDRVVGRGGGRRPDSNRIIREIVQDLENTEMSLGLVNFDELDTSQIENWTTSLGKSIPMLSRLNKQLKEMVQ